MSWIWIDLLLELERATQCVAIKNVSLAEDVVHDHFPEWFDDAGRRHDAVPVMPNTLIIEGMAQTAGILVGHARDFTENVILAKISHAEFFAAAQPGCMLRFTAEVERIDDNGASTKGVVHRCNLADSGPESEIELARIDMLFSHVDRNRSGITFPDRNFVFTQSIMDMIRRSGFEVRGELGAAG